MQLVIAEANRAFVCERQGLRHGLGEALAEGEAERYRTHAALGDLTGLDVARYNFLQERPAGASLEGYLFPDTYALPPGASALDLLSRQLDVFAQRVVPLYQEARATGTTQLSLYEVMTLASIVEREAVVAAERPAIAEVKITGNKDISTDDLKKALTGVGLGRYLNHARAVDRWAETVHNVPLLMGAELGLVGLLAMVAG